MDPNTQVLIGGTTYDFVFELAGTMPTTNNNGANQVPVQFQGSDVHVITVQDYPSAGDATRLYFFPNETATEAEMNSIGNGAIDIQNLNTTPPSSPVCFVSGTRIATPDGEVAAQELAVGMLVSTLDHGPQPILWIDHSTHRWPGADDKARPITIAPRAFGPVLPRRRLCVSPQHKILLSGPKVAARHGVAQINAPARGLTGLTGIRVMKGCRRATHYHILLPRHETLIAEGLPSESFYPGETALVTLPRAARRGLEDALNRIGRSPESYGPKTRPDLTVRQTREMVEGAKAADFAGHAHRVAPSEPALIH